MLGQRSATQTRSTGTTGAAGTMERWGEMGEMKEGGLRGLGTWGLQGGREMGGLVSKWGKSPRLVSGAAVTWRQLRAQA